MWKTVIVYYISAILAVYIIGLIIFFLTGANTKLDSFYELMAKFLPESINFIAMMIANINYYKKKVLGDTGWNPFSGVKWY